MIKETYCSFEVSKLHIVDTIKCTIPISKCVEETKKKYPPGKYTGFLTC